MKQVDLICDPEVLPRVRLLKKHMRLLEINLRIRYAATDKLTDPFIVIPGKQDSVPAPAGLRCVALHLDNRHTPQPADLAVHIPNWPARSSDHNVSELAKYLHSPALSRSGPGAGPDAAAGSATRLGALLRGWRERAPAVALLVAVVGLFSFIDFSDDNSADSPSPEGQQADNGVPVTAPATGSEASFTTAPTDVEAQSESTDFAAESPRPSVSDVSGPGFDSGGAVDLQASPALAIADASLRHRHCAPALLLSRDYPQTCFRCDTWYRRWLELH